MIQNFVLVNFCCLVVVVKKLVQKIIRSFLQKNDKRIKKLKNKDSMAPQPGKAAKVLDPPPEFLAERLALWDRLKAEQDATLAAKVPEDITVTLPDGKEVPGQSWRTTPYEVSTYFENFISNYKLSSFSLTKIRIVLYNFWFQLVGYVLALEKWNDSLGK